MVRVHDMDGDGTMDVIALSADAQLARLSVFEHLGSSGASWNERVIFHKPALALGQVSQGWTFDIADLDEDGFPDIVSATPAGIVTHLQRPLGVYVNTLVDALSVIPIACVTGDIDQDGHIDLLFVASYSVSVFLGDGNGHLTRVHHDATFGLHGGTLFDFDGDGDLDAVVTVYNKFCVHLNTGGVIDTYTCTAPDYTLRSISKVETGSFDSGGTTDLVVASLKEKYVKVMFNDYPTVSFTVVDIIYATGYGGAIEVGDFNGDGWDDLIMSYHSSYSGRLHFYANVADGSGGFTDTSHSFSGILDSPLALSLADVDGDGFKDVTVGFWDADKDMTSVVYLENDGNTGWGTSVVPIAFSSNSQSQFALGDFDGDGRVDVCAIRGIRLESYPVIMRQSSSSPGRFTYYNTPPTAGFVGDMIATDVNLDGHLDLVLAITDTHSTQVLLNNGTGFFTPHPDPGSSFYLPHVQDMAAADWNGDGVEDLVISTKVGFGWSPGSGNGLYGSFEYFFSNHDASYSSVAVGDLDMDGRMDAVSSRWRGSDPGRVVAVFGRPAGGWDEIDFGSFTSPREILIANLTADAWPDLVICDTEADTVELWENPGGTAVDPDTWTITVVSGDITDPEGVAAADFDGDGLLDLVFAEQEFVYWVANMGAAGWSVPMTLGGSPSDLSYDVRTTMADMNGDGLRDFVVSSALESAIVWYPTTHSPPDVTAMMAETTLGVVYNDLGSLQSTLDSKYFSVASGDLNGDLVDDLVFCAWYDDVVSVMFNDQSGEFNTFPQVLTTALVNPEEVALADLSGDGALDIVVVSSAASALVWMENMDGLGTFSELIYVSSVTAAAQVVLADFDGDGTVDIAVWDDDAYFVTVFMASDHGVFGAPIYTPTSTMWAGRLTAVDVGGDGALDIVGGAQSNMVVWHNTHQNGTEWALSEATTALTSVRQVVVIDYDRDNSTDLCGLTYNGVYCTRNEDHVGTTWGSPVRVSLTLECKSGAVGDLNSDGIPDILFSKDVGSRPLYVIYGLAEGGFSFPRLVRDGAYADTVVLSDFNADGIPDVVTTKGTSSQGVFVMMSRRFASLGAPSESKTVAFDGSLCISAPSSFACVQRNLARLDRCHSDTLVLPSGTFSCRTQSQVELGHAVSVQGSGDPDNPTIIDCAIPGESVGGTLFRMTDDASNAGHGGALTLSGLEIRNLGVGRGSIRGSPALRVEGTYAKLSLRNTTIRGAVSDSTVNPNRLQAGIGGVVFAAAGATVRMDATEIADASVASEGGAMVLSGAGTTATLTNTTIRATTAALTGGAVSLEDAASLTLRGSRITACTAGSGNGGAVAVNAAGTLTAESTVFDGCEAPGGMGGAVFARPGASVTLTASTLANNVAAVGGALAVAPAEADTGARVNSIAEFPLLSLSESAVGASVGVTLDGTTVRDNLANGYGGAAFVCGPDRLSLTGGETDWRGNMAARSGTLGSSDEVLVCATEPTAGVYVPGGSVVASGGAEAPSLEGPVAAFGWGTVPEATVAAGGSLEGTLVARDVYGQTVTFSALTVRLDMDTSAAPGTVQSGLTDVRLESPETSLPTVQVFIETALETETTLPAVPWTVSVVKTAGAAGPELPVLSGSLQLTACPVGVGREQGLLAGRSDPVVLCRVCPDETFSDSFGFEPCVPIKPCDANSAALGTVANGTAPNCVCDRGFYQVDVDPEASYVVICDACPRGGVCERGTGTVVPAAPGFYAISNASFVACKRGDACPGGVGSVCNDGYMGYMCNNCAAEYYSDSRRACVQCPGNAVGVLAGGVALLVLLGVGAAGVIAVAVVKARGQKEQAGASQEVDVMAMLRRRTVPASISMVLITFQVVGIFGDASFAWSSGAQDALGFFNFANVDVNLFASECSLSSFHLKYVFSVAIPAIVIVVAMVGLVVARWTALRRRLEGVTFASMMDAVVFSVAPLMYIPLSRATFVLFDCTRLPNGDFVLDQDPGVACFDGAWWTVAPAGIMALMLYVIGVPVYSMWGLLRHRQELTSPAVFARFGALYKLVRVPYWWFSVAELLKRLVVVMAAVFLSEHQVPQVGVILAVLLTSSHVNRSLRPFYFPLYNQLDFQLMCLLVAILLVGAGSYAEQAHSGTKGLLFFYCVVALVVLLCVLSVRGVVLDSLQIAKERRNRYVSSADRAVRLAALLEREAPDMDVEAGQLASECAGHLRSGRGTGGGGGIGHSALTSHPSPSTSGSSRPGGLDGLDGSSNLDASSAQSRSGEEGLILHSFDDYDDDDEYEVAVDRAPRRRTAATR